MSKPTTIMVLSSPVGMFSLVQEFVGFTIDTTTPGVLFAMSKMKENK
jgi:hypothetical protein